MDNKKVLVFGVFDGCHGGHKYFLTEAKKLGDELIVSVAQDSVIEKIKKRKPAHSMQERIQGLIELNIADEIIPGNEQINTWEILKEFQPNVIALGHDQDKLKEAIEKIKHNYPSIKEIIEVDTHNRDQFSSTNLFH